MPQRERHEKRSPKESFSVVSVERKRTTATVVCLTFATNPGVFASVRRAPNPSLFPSLSRHSLLSPSPSLHRSFVAIPCCAPLSNFRSFPFCRKQTSCRSNFSLECAWRDLTEPFGNFQMQFLNSLYRSFRDPRLSGWLAG